MVRSRCERSRTPRRIAAHPALEVNSIDFPPNVPILRTNVSRPHRGSRSSAGQSRQSPLPSDRAAAATNSTASIART